MNQDSPEREVQDEDGANAITELDHKEIRGSLKKTDDPGIQTVDDWLIEIDFALHGSQSQNRLKTN